jgi:hypothetical protein
MRLRSNRAAAVVLGSACLALAVGLAGCGTWGGEKMFFVDAQAVKPGMAVARAFGVKGHHGYDKIWAAALKAMGNDKTILESHKPSGVIKSRAGSAATGTVIGFFITPTAPNAPEYRIETVSVRAIGINSVGAEGWDPKVVEDFDAFLSKK